jgi:DNA-binding response OmpR family regulator
MSNNNKKCVLIIEDDKNIAQLEGIVLNQDYEVYFAKDGEEGLKLANEFKPDLIVLDIMMPKMDGYEVCRQVRENPELKNTKIVMVSAKSTEIDHDKGMLIGADDYIAKPFEIDELKHVIEQQFLKDDNS